MAGLRDPGVLTWIHLMRVYNKLQHHAMDHLHDFNLTPSQFDVIAQLYRAQGISQQALAEKLLVTKGNVCGLIDRLEVLKLVERRADPVDRRANLLFLTEEGEKLAECAIPAHESFIVEHLSVLTGEDQQALHSLLRQLDRALAHH